jgi:protein required for attachment to host cells
MPQANMERRNHAWFALADSERCRLLCCRLTMQSKQHVDEYGALEKSVPEHERDRPATQGGMTHDIEEEERRFAGDIAGWLRKKATEHDMSRLVIFAPPRMLGVLRKTPFGPLTGHIEEIKGDLMGLNPDELADHPMVRELVRVRHTR